MGRVKFREVKITIVRAGFSKQSRKGQKNELGSIGKKAFLLVELVELSSAADQIVESSSRSSGALRRSTSATSTRQVAVAVRPLLGHHSTSTLPLRDILSTTARQLLDRHSTAARPPLQPSSNVTLPQLNPAECSMLQNLFITL